ncbi:MAG: alpha-amylase family glycosyl hydrolase [Polyangiaceae bacterium]
MGPRRLSTCLVLLLACGGETAAPSGGFGGVSWSGGGAVGGAGLSTGGSTGDGAAMPNGGAGGGGGAGGAAPTERAFESRVLYLALTDRFQNGDPTNDAAGDASCFDAADPIKFHGGDFTGLRTRLAYLSELGASALWITPVYRQTGPHNGQCGYHGYWADYSDDPAIGLEPKLGTDVELDALLADAHDRDIAVLADMVVNHSGRGAALVSSRPDWFHAAATCASLGDPVVYCPLSGLPDFAQENPDVAAYLTTSSVGFLGRFAFDGVRMDTAKHVYRPYFADDWVPAVRALRPEAFLLAEVFDDSGPAALEPLLDTGFDSAFGFALHTGLVNAFAKGGKLDGVASPVQAAVSTLGLARASRLVNFVDNHDVPRFPSEMPTGLSTTEATARYRSALVALFTAPGIPQLLYGDELGMIGKYPDNRRDMPSWAWDPATRSGSFSGYLGDPAETFDLVATLARARVDNPALHRGRYVELWRPNGSADDVFAFFRGDGDSRVIAIFNNSTHAIAELKPKIQSNPGLEQADRDALADGTALTVIAQVGDADASLADGRLVLHLGANSALVVRAP